MIDDKFCRLDINMTIDGQIVDLEIQVSNEGDYPERSLYYWAREYSSALGEGGKYADLPRTIIISILSFRLFEGDNFHSEYQALETTIHKPLTDKLSLHYFELPKLPEGVTADDGLKLWLALFNAETEEELKKIEAMGVTVMNQAIGAYRKVTATGEFRELERQRHYAALNRNSALYNAEMKGKAEGKAEGKAIADKEWQSVVADKDAEIANLRAQLEAKQ